MLQLSVRDNSPRSRWVWVRYCTWVALLTFVCLLDLTYGTRTRKPAATTQPRTHASLNKQSGCSPSVCCSASFDLSLTSPPTGLSCVSEPCTT
eukprot:3757569-Prymnesium_polylepis.1